MSRTLREVHRRGDEAAWWKTAGLDSTVAARALWLETHPLATAADRKRELTNIAVASTDKKSAKRDRPVSKRGSYYKTNPIGTAGPQ
jgi:hypothetical protein